MVRSLGYLAVAAIIIAALFFKCSRDHVPLIAEDLKTRSRLALNEADLDHVTIKNIDGLNVILGGEVSDSDQRLKAIRTVEDVYGVYSAIDEMTETAKAQAITVPGKHRFSATADNEKVELTGMVRDAQMRASIVGAARRAFGERRVIDRLEIVPSTPEHWTPSLRILLNELGAFRSGKLDILGSHLSLAGSVSSQQRRDNAQAALTTAAGDLFSSRLDVAVLAPGREVIDNCQSSVNATLASATIQFNSGSATISVDSYPLLEELADIVARCEGVMVEIQGHTDSDGDEQVNLRLSERRADAVRQYLIDEGIAAAQLRTQGFGESKPRADNATRDGRALNRRIEFVITGN